jgi:ADP-ribose pyrophosphatase YjhB (NUDIX family)
MGFKRPAPIEGFKKYLHRKRPAITEVIKEATAGGIVWRKNQKTGKVEILLHKDPKERWTIPKGHIEAGETAREAAEREIREETGLQEMKVMKWLGKINFQYRRQNSLILMTTHIYLVEARGDTNKLQKEDFMKSIGWMDANEALDKIEYEDIGKLILVGLKEIRNAA